MFDYLFSPIRINNLEIKNRIVYPSLGLLYSYDRKLNKRYIDFYTERAKGGAGIVTVGPIGIDFLGSGVMAPAIDKDEALTDFMELADKIKNEGSRAWVQLFHAGGYSPSMVIGNQKSIAPSAVYSAYTRETPREMSLDDIKSVQEAFINGALRAREAGFDGVEIIASAGYLITQFLSPLKNQRSDQYGGSFENRIRFAREIIEGMRRSLGPEFPVTIRMAGNDFVPGSNTSNEMKEIAKVYEKAGADAINVTGGWHEAKIPQLSMDVPRGGFSYLAGMIKNAVSVPVMASNRISDPYTAEGIIRDNIADMVCLGRVLLADPYWPKKVQEGEADEVRPCIACSQGCTDEVFSGRPVRCQINPMTGFEGERKIVKSPSPKNVMIIGAGPAGLEAAVTAAMAGHRVDLYEKSDSIGGQLIIAGVPPHKNEIWELIRYYDEMIYKHGVELHLNTEADISLINKKNPDYIIAAEGAEPFIPDIDGIDDEKIYSSWEVLRNDPRLGKRVAVIGGGSIGLETALFIAEKGTISPETLHFLFKYEAESIDDLKMLACRGNRDITIFELLPKIGKGIGKSTKWIVLDNLKRSGISVHAGVEIISLRDGRVRFMNEGREEIEIFDDIIIATGSKSVKSVSGKLAELNRPHAVVGDCVRPAKIMDAVHEGFLAAAGI